VLVGIRPTHFGFLFAGRAGFAVHLEAWPDRRAPGYRELLEEADRRLPASARVAVLYSPREWAEGYSYAYYRAQYFLAGRIVIPLAWTDRARFERLEEAEYVVAYRSTLPQGAAWESLFSTPEGAILRRVQ